MSRRRADETRSLRRRCEVCDWEEEATTGATSGEDCPWCHAPTYLIGVEVPAKVHAAALGRLGGAKGGYARAAALSPRRRTALAAKAARARWRKAK